MRPRNISDWHFEQIICRNWGMMLVPKNEAGAQHSLSPVGAFEVAVMEPASIFEL
jgi:hypothetical protein